MSIVRRVRRPGPLVAVSLGYFVLASAVLVWRGISVSPDYIFLLLLPVAALSGRFLGYLRDWLPFIAIFLGWEAMRGIAPKLGIPPHVTDLVALEHAVFFGHLPNQVLQGAITGRAQTTVALLCTVVYFLHFVFPLAVGMVLWLVNRTQFLRFVTALMGMAFFCFFIFLLVPTAPPWYAAQHGDLPGVHDLISQSLPSYISPYYHSLNPNPVAAFPSLHMAFPVLSFLALRRVYPRAAWFAFGWSILVAFSVMFLGQHYGVDVLAGIVVACASWAVMVKVVVPRMAMFQVRQERPVELAGAGAVA